MEESWVFIVKDEFFRLWKGKGTFECCSYNQIVSVFVFIGLRYENYISVDDKICLRKVDDPYF